MARFAASFQSVGAGSTTLPIGGITAAAGVKPRIKEIGIFNTTTAAVALAVRRITALGTPGASPVELSENDTSKTNLCTVLDTWTGAPTFVAGNLRVVTLGAAAGNGVIFTFSGEGLVIEGATTEGVVVVPLTGTGQICKLYFAWEE